MSPLLAHINIYIKVDHKYAFIYICGVRFAFSDQKSRSCEDKSESGRVNKNKSTKLHYLLFQPPKL